jgi:uncharacterized membrane protein
MLIHPAAVHFPIALWLASSFFDVLAWRRSQAVYRDMAFWLVGLGLLGAAVSILSGWTDLLAQESQGVGKGLLLRHNVHSVLAYAASTVYLAVFLWRWRAKNRSSAALLLLSLLGAALITVTGYLGGEMRSVM